MDVHLELLAPNLGLGVTWLHVDHLHLLRQLEYLLVHLPFRLGVHVGGLDLVADLLDLRLE
jgi:hypothetical protein